MVTLGREPSGCRGSAHAYLSNLCCSKCCLFTLVSRVNSPKVLKEVIYNRTEGREAF